MLNLEISFGYMYTNFSTTPDDFSLGSIFNIAEILSSEIKI